jgi:hypothetical protein
MTYQPLVQTDDLSETVPTKINENFRKRAFLNAAAKSADFTVWADDGSGEPRDIYLVTTGASTITATLPTVASGDASLGRVCTVMKVDSGAGSVTIDGNGSQTINGSATVSLASQYDYRTLVSNGTEWFVIGQN